MPNSECPAAGSMPEKSEDSTPQDFMYKSMVYLCRFETCQKMQKCKHT